MMYDPSFMTFEQADALFHYDPLTGIVTRKTSRGGFRKGTRVGYEHPDADNPDLVYRRLSVTVYGHKYDVAEHRLIVLLMTREWPTHQVDHINGDGTDNRWCNLRCVTQQGNMRNLRMPKRNTSGYLNISFDKRRNKYIVAMRHDGPRFFKRVGTIAEAIRLRDWAYDEYRDGFRPLGVTQIQHPTIETAICQSELPQTVSLTGLSLSAD